MLEDASLLGLNPRKAKQADLERMPRAQRWMTTAPLTSEEGTPQELLSGLHERHGQNLALAVSYIPYTHAHTHG